MVSVDRWGDSLPVANEDLSFSEIGGGYRASIALDDIENIPNIRSSETTPVEWYAMADDNAGNSAMSDADADEDDGRNYTFNVDGEDPEIMRVYTGDWFDTVAEEVKGDRALGVETNICPAFPTTPASVWSSTSVSMALLSPPTTLAWTALPPPMPSGPARVRPATETTPTLARACSSPCLQWLPTRSQW